MNAVDYLNARFDFCTAHLKAKLCGCNNIKRRDKECCPFWSKSANKPFCSLHDIENIRPQESVEIISKWVEETDE